MFVSDRFVYLELHKTGCTHIRNILKELLHGELLGKHNQVSQEILNGRIALGSVRNPWVWYTSLWAYGCDHKGAVFNNVTRITELDWRRNPCQALLRWFANRDRNPQAWLDTYQDINDAQAFRTWLGMMHDGKYLRDMGGPYASSHIKHVAGLMTYRYLNLFCSLADDQRTPLNLACPGEVEAYAAEHGFIQHFIRNESLETDLFQALASHGVEVPAETREALLRRPKTNTSSRQHGPQYYYDAESAALVAEREQLIVKTFGYSAPLVTPAPVSTTTPATRPLAV